MTLPLFMLLWIVLEIRLRYLRTFKSNEIVENAVFPIFQPLEVESFDRQNHTLVIIDNIVLDVHNYLDHHPGGKFLLKKNVGRDISKFFYGGYQMINDKPAFSAHAHSYHAMKVAKSMLLGFLSEHPANLVETVIINRNAVNAADFSFCFQTVDKKANPGFRHWHSDLSMLGKHYLVLNSAHPGVKRHYTICNVLNPLLNKAVLSAVDNALNSKQV